jgi:hypothetical protein
MAKDPSDNVISHWHHLIQNFQTSPLEFYQAVERGVHERQVPETMNARVDYREGGILTARREYLQIKRGRLVFDICAAPFGTGFFFSSWLSEKSSNMAAFLAIGLFVSILMFGGALMNEVGFFPGLFVILIAIPILFAVFRGMVNAGAISRAVEEALLEVPYLGGFYGRIFKPNTFYRMDTAIMYQEMVHAAVLDAVDELTKARGVRGLTELERKPVLKEFFRR